MKYLNMVGLIIGIFTYNTFGSSVVLSSIDMQKQIRAIVPDELSKDERIVFLQKEVALRENADLDCVRIELLSKRYGDVLIGFFVVEDRLADISTSNLILNNWVWTDAEGARFALIGHSLLSGKIGLELRIDYLEGESVVGLSSRISSFNNLGDLMAIVKSGIISIDINSSHFILSSNNIKHVIRKIINNQDILSGRVTDKTLIDLGLIHSKIYCYSFGGSLGGIDVDRYSGA